MKRLRALIEAVLLGIVVFPITLIIQRVYGMDSFSIIELAGFSVAFSLVFYLVRGWGGSDGKFSPFREIDVNILKSILYPWVATNAYKDLIKKVVLYRTTLDSQPQVTLEYIVFFDVVYNQKTEEARKVHHELLRMKTPIMGDDFARVYKGDVPLNFHDEWLLTDKKPQGFSDKNAAVLFSSNPMSRLFK